MEASLVTPIYVQQFLLASAGIGIDETEAAQLVPLVLASRAALRRLERFDLTNVRPAGRFEPVAAGA